MVFNGKTKRGQLGFITAIAKEAEILRKTQNYSQSEIICVGTQKGSAYTEANKLVKNGCSVLISFGLAGALDPKLAAGDLIIPKSVADAEANIFKSDYDLQRKMVNHFSKHFNVSEGKLFGSEAIIWSIREKKRIFQIHKATTVDMESLGVARAATENNCPFLIVRAISDTANQDLPIKSLASVGLNGSINPGNILKDLTKNLNETPSLLRLAYNSHKAFLRLNNVAKLGFGF